MITNLYNSKNESLSFGIIGCSKVAEKYFIPAVNSSSLAKLEIVGSRSLTKAREFAKKFGCQNYGNYDDVLRSDVDAVYISLPVGLHEEWAIKAANAGKHVLCEKSATTSYESAKKMINTCRKNKVRILEGFSFRFHPQHDKVKKYIQNKSLGKLITFHGAYGFPPPSEDDIRWKKELGGGALNDAGCYPLCASRMLLQTEPRWVVSQFVCDRRNDVDIKISALLSFPDGINAFISSGFDNSFQSMYSIWGSRAIISVKRAYTVPKNLETHIYLNKDDKIKEVTIPMIDQTKLMIDNFCEEILGKNHCWFNLEDELLKQAKVMDAIRLSGEKKRIVSLNEIK